MWLADLLPFALLGAVLGLDVVSFPQAMISRPVVAATLAGAVAGQPWNGLLAGAMLELFALETLPFGASRYPEWGSAAVVGGALFAAQPELRPGAMSVAVVGALAVAWVGGWSMVELRRLNGRWARERLDRLEAGERGVAIGLQLGGIAADLLRGGLLTFVALLVLQPLARRVLLAWSVDVRISRAVVAGAALTVAAGAVWRLFHAVPGARWLFLGGLGVGLAFLALA